MPNKFFISDTHFGHAGICEFTRHDDTALRPWDNADEMNEAMVDRWNAVVNPQDKVYHCGDVVINRRYLPILDRLKGRKILIRGNHDIFPTKDYMKYFEEIYGVYVMENKKYALTHVPMHEASVIGRKKPWVNIHGHLHEGFVRENHTSIGVQHPNYLSVCVEHTNYTPLSFEEMEAKVIKNKENYEELL